MWRNDQVEGFYFNCEKSSFSFDKAHLIITQFWWVVKRLITSHCIEGMSGELPLKQYHPLGYEFLHRINYSLRLRRWWWSVRTPWELWRERKSLAVVESKLIKVWFMGSSCDLRPDEVKNSVYAIYFFMVTTVWCCCWSHNWDKERKFSWHANGILLNKFIYDYFWDIYFSRH